MKATLPNGQLFALTLRDVAFYHLGAHRLEMYYSFMHNKCMDEIAQVVRIYAFPALPREMLARISAGRTEASKVWMKCRDLHQAARIDGASEAKTFVRIALPMIKPGIGALAIFTFINSWNDYFMQLIMLSSTSKLTISLGIAKLQAENSTDYGLIMAGAALAAVPIIIVFLAFQKYFTKGITMGAVKG